MLGNMQPTPIDLEFSLFGIPVRVHPVFWLTAAFIVWQVANATARGMGQEGAVLILVLIGVACVFVSILVHELGHAVTTRLFGHRPSIVLEFFGGYATVGQHTTGKAIAVLIAGPAAGFLLFFLTLGFQIFVEVANWTLHPFVDFAVKILLFANLVWNILNLIPIIPLDGGQIMREVLTYISPNRGYETALIISMVVAVLAAASAYMFRQQLTIDPTFAIVFCAFFAFQNFQMYQFHRNRY